MFRKLKIIRELNFQNEKKNEVIIMINYEDLNEEEKSVRRKKLLSMLEEIDKKIYDLDIGLIVFNAALSPIGLFHNTSPDVLQKMIDLNCRAPMLLSHYFGNKMKQVEKHILVPD